MWVSSEYPLKPHVVLKSPIGPVSEIIYSPASTVDSSLLYPKELHIAERYRSIFRRIKYSARLKKFSLQKYKLKLKKNHLVSLLYLAERRQTECVIRVNYKRSSVT